MFLTRGLLFALALAAVQAQSLVTAGKAQHCEFETSYLPLPGGLFPVDVRVTTIQSLAKLSLPAIKKHLGYPHQFELLEILQAFEQKVAGTNYHLVLRVDPNPEQRPIITPVCRVIVFEPLDGRDPVVTEVKCDQECAE